jgi:hypothetical protein
LHTYARPSKAKNGRALGQSCSVPVLTDLRYNWLGPGLMDQISSRLGVGNFHYSAVIVLSIVFHNLKK